MPAGASFTPGSRTRPLTLKEAREFATGFVTENADLFMQRAPASPQPVRPDAQGLLPHQAAAVGTVGLCPNCQQPKNNHLPGCARQTGEEPTAITKNPLSPASA